MIRFAFGEHLLPLPRSRGARQSALQDVTFLARYFGLARSTTFKVSLLPALPKAPGRWPAVLEEPSGLRNIVVERQELTNEDCKQAQARLVSRGETAKQGLHQLNPLELAAILREAVGMKLAASALLKVTSAERALLLRSRVEGTNETTYLATAVVFGAMPVEHGFLIARGRLLELW